MEMSLGSVILFLSLALWFLNLTVLRSVVWTGPNEISIRDTTAVLPVLGVHGSPLYITKGLASRCPGKQISSSIALHEYRPVIAKRVRQLVDKLSSPKGNTVDLAQWMGFFA